MKKLFFILMFLSTVCFTKAQNFYGAASIGVHTVHVSEDGGSSASQTAFQISPEVGYQFNKTWSVGLTFAYQLTHVEDFDVSVINFYPYVRATFARVSKVDFFGELGLGYGHQSASGFGVDGFVSGLRPGIMIHFSPKFAITARTQLIGYDYYDGISTFNFGLNGNYTIGAQFTF